MPGGYPILLEVSDKRIVIVGGGNVALRKVKGLIAGGAKAVRVVCPKLHEDMPADVEHIAAMFQPDQLNRAQLVFAATDRADVNDAVVWEARARNIWVSRADGSEDVDGDFTSLASRQVGSILLALSAGGSPALSATLRDKLVAGIEPHWPGWSDAAAKLRVESMQTIDAADRPVMLRSLAGEEAEAAYRSGGEAALRAWFSNAWGRST